MYPLQRGSNQRWSLPRSDDRDGHSSSLILMLQLEKLCHPAVVVLMPSVSCAGMRACPVAWGVRLGRGGRRGKGGKGGRGRR